MYEQQARRPAPRYWLLSLAVAAAAGFLGANAFADAAGAPPIPPNHGEFETFLRFLSGALVGLVTLALVQFLLSQAHAVAGLLGRTPHRPALPVAVVLVVCGTLCFLGALALEWHAVTYTASASATLIQGMHLNGIPGGAGGISLHVQPPFLTHVAALAVFLAGVALIALGTWASIPREGHLPAAGATPAEVAKGSEAVFPGGNP
jgi:hypothetical protein